MAITRSLQSAVMDGVGINFRNRIINGDMRIDQRNAGASKSVSGDDIYTVDRWKGWSNGGGVFSVQQSSTAPNNFNNSVVLTVTTADSSVAAGDNYRFAQPIEGYNIADLGFGTSAAKTVTVSFWVRSNLTGTYGGSLYSVSGGRSYVYQYTINSANTWEFKTITVPGDTSGTWGSTNSFGITVYFDLGSGSTYQNATGSWVSSEKFSTSGNANWIGTLSNNLYITGVQLEVGTAATPFERRPYGTELALCQRYCQIYNSSQSSVIMGWWNSTTVNMFFIQPPVVFRSSPTVSFNGGTIIAEMVGTSQNNTYSATVPYSSMKTNGGYVALTSSTGTSTAGNLLAMRFDGTGILTLSAEL